MRGARERHECAVRCDGREWRDRRARRMRTAKSCGSGVAVLALRSGEAKLLWDNGGKRAVLREEHEVSRKAIAQGRPGCSRCPVCSCAPLAKAQTAHGTAGAASTWSSLRPLISKRVTKMQTSGDQRCESAKLYPLVIASAAKQSMYRHKERMDCFAALAMTRMERSVPAGPHPQYRSPDEQRDIRGPSHRPGCRFAHPGYKICQQ
jgi:hypothetical protein